MEAEPEVTEAEFAGEYLENLRVLRLGLSVLCVEGVGLLLFTKENNILRSGIAAFFPRRRMEGVAR
jgi:hypothetical protein